MTLLSRYFGREKIRQRDLTSHPSTFFLVGYTAELFEYVGFLPNTAVLVIQTEDKFDTMEQIFTDLNMDRGTFLSKIAEIVHIYVGVVA